MATVSDLPGTWEYLYKPQMKLDADGQGYVSTLGFVTDFSNLSPFVLTVGGTSQLVTAGSLTFNRIVPLQHPLFPGLWARRVQCEAFGTASVSSSALADLWSHVRIYVEFASVTYGITGAQAYMELSVDQGGLYTTAPGRQFKFPSGEKIDQDAGAFATQTVYGLTLFQCPNLNDTAINAANAAPVSSATFLGFAAGLILFGGCKSTFTTAVGGVTSYQRSLTFTHRSYDWNQAMQKNGTLDTPVDPAGNKIYPTSDLNLLFN